MAYMVHLIISLLFIIILPLPIVARIKSRNGEELGSAQVWKSLVVLANIGLFVSLISGILMYPVLTSFRLWIAVALILILGAFLGIFSKRLKLYQLSTNDDEKQQHLQKIAKVGYIYIATVIGTFLFMSNWYNF